MINPSFLIQVHRSVHAGEFGPSDVVFQAIERLGAERIVFGYSVSTIKSKSLTSTIVIIMWIIIAININFEASTAISAQSVS